MLELFNHDWWLAELIIWDLERWSSLGHLDSPEWDWCKIPTPCVPFFLLPCTKIHCCIHQCHWDILPGPWLLALDTWDQPWTARGLSIASKHAQAGQSARFFRIITSPSCSSTSHTPWSCSLCSCWLQYFPPGGHGLGPYLLHEREWVKYSKTYSKTTKGWSLSLLIQNRNYKPVLSNYKAKCGALYFSQMTTQYLLSHRPLDLPWPYQDMKSNFPPLEPRWKITLYDLWHKP